MRILALSTWWPEPADNGSRMRIMNLLRHLAVRHTVDLIAFTQGPAGEVQRDELQRMCASIVAIERPSRPIRYHHRVASLVLPEPASVRATWCREMAHTVLSAASRLRPDVVIAFQPDMVPYVLRLGEVPLILEELELAYTLEHYLQHSNPLLRLRYWLTAVKHRHYVATLVRHFKAITVVSVREAALVRDLMRDYPVEIVVVPNGADLEGCLQYRYDPEPDTLIYPGALTYAANLDAMRYFLAEIFPRIRQLRPRATLRITGKHTPEQRAALPDVPGVELTGYVNDVHALISRSAVEVVPLREGGGTRLKILEALALGTPVISTSKGAEGLDLVPGRDLLIADTPAAFAETTVRLLTHPEERARLSAHGRRAVAERYDWRTIGARFVALVETVATQKKLAYDTRIHTA
ncbi:MAG: glycosyltransferase family 4 protein [Chloroflexaceae bacterium]|nr:glycosyltransferase family 4 protein [Chloroflexaceae bacterium]